MSTNTSSYIICSAPNVYIFVYILIETHIAPLRQQYIPSLYALGHARDLNTADIWSALLTHQHFDDLHD